MFQTTNQFCYVSLFVKTPTIIVHYTAILNM